MNLSYRLMILALAAAAAGLAQNSSQTVSGRWQGSFKVPRAPDLDLVVDLTKNAKGAWVGSFSQPQIGATDIPVDQLSVDQGKVHFVVNSVAGGLMFDGTLSSDGKELTGTFGDAQHKSPLTLKRVGPPQVKLPEPSTPITREMEGAWHATLTSGDVQIRMNLKLARGADGTATGTIANVDRSGSDIPLTTVQQKDKSLDFEMRPQAVRFHGTLNAAGNALTGQWTQMTQSVALTFERGPFPPNSILPKGFEGTWTANMDAGGEYKVTMLLTLSRAADGTSIGMFKTSDGKRELPVTAIALKNKSVAFTVPGLPATFNGTVNDAGSEFTGTWVLMNTGMPVTFKHSAEKKP